MELDLTSVESSQRTLHWFINDKQQRYSINQVPPRVRFAVCFSFSVLVTFTHLHSFLLPPLSTSFPIIFYIFKVIVCGRDETLEFKSMEKITHLTSQPSSPEYVLAWDCRN